MTRNEIADVMATVVDDCENDAAADVPMTPLGLGTARGEMLATIAAVARAVQILADTPAVICPNVAEQIRDPAALYEDACADCGCALILHNKRTGQCCLHTAVERL